MATKPLNLNQKISLNVQKSLDIFHTIIVENIGITDCDRSNENDDDDDDDDDDDGDEMRTTTESSDEQPETTTTESRFICPETFGYYEHQNCWQYYQCSNGIAFELVCAKGTQWSQESKTCVTLKDCSDHR
ncbi:hypothetical protein SSS_03142 [Sarcoptes scabiei]|uniref:Chitin-binding type-2 domain-containing protein n=1 Tax=Sarcoptes scabiei TaxID=52283 RepID=A0A834RGR1_SARSC|nr:hypothetical protein SSS_03142 [Sarcoptes scabiei]